MKGNTHWIIIAATSLGLSWFPTGVESAQPKASSHAVGNTKEEALFVRRIIEFWKDKESDQVKQQIHQFLETYPESTYRDSLFVVLGDTYWNEQSYEQALIAYRSIKAEKYRERVFNNLIDSLYHLGRWKGLENALKNKVVVDSSSLTPEKQLRIYYYAEALQQQARTEEHRAKRKEKYQKALDHFEVLTTGNYAIASKLAKSDILAATGHPLEAAALYRELIGYAPDQKEKLLLQAGRLQAVHAPHEAILTFSELQQLKGVTQAEAALYKAYLLFEQGRYHDLIQEESELAQHLNPDQRPLLNYLVGRTHFALNATDKASDLLTPLAEESRKEGSLLNRKALLLTLLSTSYKKNKLDEVVAWSQEFSEAFPEDPLLPRVLYLQASAYKNCDHYAKAVKTIDKLLSRHPDFAKKEAALFERNTLLYKQGLWEECRKAACNYVHAYPESEWTPAMLPYIPSSTVKMLEHARSKGEPTERLSEQLLKDIDLALQVPGAISEEQRAKYLLKKAKTHFELKQIPETLAITEELLQKCPQDPQIYQAHLLAASCYRESNQEMPKFAFHVEKAIEHNPRLHKNENLRLNLFSAYLALAQDRKEQVGKNEDDLLTQTYVNQAAGHLLEAMNGDSETNGSIRNENKLWLANYLYNKTQQHVPDEYWLEPLQNTEAIKEALRAQLALEKVLAPDTEGHLKPLTEENLSLEQEYFKLASVRAWLGDTEGEEKLLSGLLEQQKIHPEWNWKLKNRTLYAYGNVKEKAGDLEAAKEAFLKAEQSSDPAIAQAAQLHLTRIEVAQLPIEERTIESNSALELLKKYQSLQIRKALKTEPIHLEAALDLASFRATLDPADMRDEQWLGMLRRAKEDFTTREDLCSQDYHAAMELDPSKSALFQNYLIVFDAHIAQLEARKSQREHNQETADTQNTLARALYRHLLERPPGSTQYLVREAQKGLDSMQNTDSLPFQDL